MAIGGQRCEEEEEWFDPDPEWYDDQKEEDVPAGEEDWFDCDDGAGMGGCQGDMADATDVSAEGRGAVAPVARGGHGGDRHEGVPAHEGVSEDSGGRAAPVARGTMAADKPLVEPPEFADRIKDSDRQPYWTPGAFPTLFQNETGDPHNYVLKEVDLILWGPHVLRSKGWFAQAHMTFMYWWMNMIQRFQALSAKKWFVRDNPRSTGYTVEDLGKMSVRGLTKQMVGYTANIPITKASKAHLRKFVLAMVRQIEIETRSPATSPLGEIPCHFGTLTSQRYQWDGVIRIIAQVEGIAD